MNALGKNMQPPWYRRVRRWGQTNLTEVDALECDVSFWRQYWRRTRIQGIIVNAGGVVAYYPSMFEHHYRAQHLGERDLLGEFVAAAREEGLAVLARMDSNRALRSFYEAHPDWFACNAQGEPCIVQGRYMACVNSPYYKQYLPEVMREIIQRYSPDGFTDNSWTGPGRKHICHCPHCRRKFAAETGRDLPQAVDWEDPLYRRWIRWSYRCRTENWELNNRVTTEAGGPDCLWLGMVNGNPVNTHLNFCDLNQIGQRSKIIMTDHQSRDDICGFEQNGLNGKLLHEVSGYDVLIPESMALYVRGDQTFRRSSNPVAESRLWMYSGFAGGISPWWHHVGGKQEDRRQFATVGCVMKWHEANERYLYDRTPVASIGLLWSHENTDFYGEHKGRERVLMPWRGFTRALIRSRIPFLQVHAENIRTCFERLGCLVLPDLAVMSNDQCDALREYVARGGSLVITGASSMIDDTGRARSDFGIADILGCSHLGPITHCDEKHNSSWECPQWHSYLRIQKPSHALFAGFEETDIIPFGGTLQTVACSSRSAILATEIPPFPIYPPEFSWMRKKDSNTPGLVAFETDAGGRIVYFPSDIDRCYGKRALPDHGDLLANALRWALKDDVPFTVEGPGTIDCNLYRQGSRYIMHLCNFSGTGLRPGYLEENLGIGPITVRIAVGTHRPRRAFLAVAENDCPLAFSEGKAVLTVERIDAHEVIVLE